MAKRLRQNVRAERSLAANKGVTISVDRAFSISPNYDSEFIVHQISYEALIGRNCVRKVLNFGHVDVPVSANSSSRRVIRFSTFEVNLHTGELRQRGQKVKLQEQPLQVLAALLERPGEMVTR